MYLFSFKVIQNTFWKTIDFEILKRSNDQRVGGAHVIRVIMTHCVRKLICDSPLAL